MAEGLAGGRTIVVATRNPGKLAEIRHALQGLTVAVASLADWPHVCEPREDGLTFADNAADKAMYYARQTGLWALADDSGLVVDALDGAPGVRSARFSGVESADRAQVDRANNVALLQAIADVPDSDRTAQFVCCLALADADRILLTASGSVCGRILRCGRGDNGFGYDPLFFLPDYRCTAAELDREAKNAVSHRGQAVRQFVSRLDVLLGP